MKEYRYAIFDMDGTLLDSMPYWHNLGMNYLIKNGKSPESNLNDVIESMTMKESAEYFINHYGIDKSVEQVVTEVNSLIEENYRSNIQLKGQAANYLSKLHDRGVKMCIATTTSEYLARIACERTDILKYFSFILSSDEVGCGKNDPKIYHEAMKRLGAAAEQTVIYEDAVYAIRTVIDAGMNCIIVKDEAQGTIEQELIDKSVEVITCYGR